MKTHALTWSLLAMALGAVGCQREAAQAPAADPAATAPAGESAPAAAGPAADPALLTQAQALFKPIPDQAPALPGNPVTPDKVALGKMLFFDGRLSASGVISCNSCHNLGMGGIDGVPTSIGHGFQKGPRNAQVASDGLRIADIGVDNTVVRAPFAGVVIAKAAQPGEIVSPLSAGGGFTRTGIGTIVDMDSLEIEVDVGEAYIGRVKAKMPVEATLNSMPGYVKAFELAFPDEAKAVNFDNMAKAIEAFETTLITPGAPFDVFLKGDARALTADQQTGLKLFMEKGCASCHNGINLGGQAYFPFGVVHKPSDDVRPTGDVGRLTVTKSKADEYAFRAAPLRNVAATAPYFHSGKVWKLQDAVTIMGDAQLGATLTPDEAEKIHLFLHSLTAPIPDVRYPELPERSDTTPQPAG